MDVIASTGRLLIRPLSPADLPALAGILGDPEVMRYSVRGVCDAAATGRFLDWCLASYARDGIGPWALVEKGGTDLIGFCGIGQERVGEVEEINLGYRLARSCWGRGLATEAVQAVLSFALGQQARESVVVIVEPEHMASLRVAEKAGFRRYQETRFHGKSVRLYRLTRAEWLAAGNSVPGI